MINLICLVTYSFKKGAAQLFFPVLVEGFGHLCRRLPRPWSNQQPLLRAAVTNAEVTYVPWPLGICFVVSLLIFQQNLEPKPEMQ